MGIEGSRPMTWILRLGLVLLLALGLMGMGGFDSNEKAGEIPIPDREVTATITDVAGTLITLSQFSLNGQTVLKGKLGAGMVTIPFSQIKVLTIWPDAKALQAKVELVDQSVQTLSLDRGQTVFGRLKFGIYQIRIDQLKKVEIGSVSEKKK
jgi:hypothetical protein